MADGGSGGRSRDVPAPYSLSDPRARELREILTRIYFQPKLIADVLHAAGMNPGDYDFDGSARLIWGGILRTAYNRMELDPLLDEINKDAAARRWRDRIGELRGPSPVVEAEGDAELVPPGDHEDELIVGEQSTLLDVAFLALGLTRTPSVARLTVQWGASRCYGTGFLIDERHVLTNHHVLFYAGGEAADRVEAWFNYERSADGAPAKVDPYAGDPSRMFGDKAHDWAVIELVERPHERYRPLSIATPSRPVQEGDRVYIIQHALGGYKQLGMHHNVVTRVTSDRIQYMTDTDGGSSGSPVFNDRWEVIALHHGGVQVERAKEGSRFSLDDRGREPLETAARVDYRNQGVRIERVIEGLSRWMERGTS